MNKTLLIAAAGLLGLSTLVAVTQAQTASLRGDTAANAKAEMFDKKRTLIVDGGFKRAWKLQPPSIPHKIGRERISLDENTCMRCHAPENAKKEKAPKIGDSHYVDAAGKKSAKLNGRRYFCSQCHTTQVNAKPLIENTFDSAGN